MNGKEDAVSFERERADKAERAFYNIYGKYNELEARYEAKWWKWQTGFLVGILLNTIVFGTVKLVVDRLRERTTQQEAVQQLLDAAKTAQEVLR